MAGVACAAIAAFVALGVPPVSTVGAGLAGLACIGCCVWHTARRVGGIGGRAAGANAGAGGPGANGERAGGSVEGATGSAVGQAAGGSLWDALSTGLEAYGASGPDSKRAGKTISPAALAAGSLALGIVAYVACACALSPALDAANSAFAFAVLPLGVTAACAGCLVWAAGLLRRFAQDEARAFSDGLLQNNAAKSKGGLRANFFAGIAGADSLLAGQDDDAARANPGAPSGPIRVVRAAVCAVLVALGAALCTALPSHASGGQALAGVALGVVCAGLLAAFAWALARTEAQQTRLLEAFKADAERKLDIAQARKAAADAEHMAAEAARAVKVANQRAIETGNVPSIESSCILAASRFELSAREQEVLLLMASGRSRPRIAEDLTLTLSTVNTHAQKIYRKMGVHSIQELLDLLEELR